ncbi:head-tail connector protein [Serratia ureilytica]|uniref:head-tail connector protein n=1 Tax=Serratia ureilytica TaxID=300181 RepID=UPI0018E7DD93|nr:head-tail connector protein [Serratia ureilytica]MBJ2078280.1 phage gp6-like head-tail connector protein [Serratia ureilytica]
MLLKLEEIKQQCRIDSDMDDEDEFLKLLGAVVQKRTETRINRTLYADSVPESDPDGLVLPADIKMGMLMLCSHFYENRIRRQLVLPTGANYSGRIL